MPKDLTAVADDAEFAELLAMIEEARARAARAINLELVGLYWNVGAYVSERTRTEGWGNAVIARFSESVRRRFPGITGFSPVNIWRMRTFYDTYADREDLSALLKEVSWTNHTTILSGAKTEEAREFYLRLTAANGYSSRELERQVDSMLFERAAVSDINMRSLVERQPALAALRDSYVLEFLDLPTPHRESDLRRAIVINLRDFILEFGKDFAFVGRQVHFEVDGDDFFIDLLFFHVEQLRYVVIELKAKKFEPRDAGQLGFYVALVEDRLRRPQHQATVGMLLVADKNDSVVRYALAGTTQPIAVSRYELAASVRAALPTEDVIARAVAIELGGVDSAT